jgi:4-oxalocrotonate tautomerase
MPVVIVEMWEGRSADQKAVLIQGITDVFKQIGVQPEWLNIIIHEVPKTNWGSKGKPASQQD